MLWSSSLFPENVPPVIGKLDFLLLLPLLLMQKLLLLPLRLQQRLLLEL